MADNAKHKVTKFDMLEDDKIRKNAKKHRDVLLFFKDAGFTIKRVIDGKNPAVSKQFKLPSTTDLKVIEVGLSNDPEKDFDIKEDFVSLVDTNKTLSIIDNKEYKYENNELVQRYLIKIDKGN